MSQGADGASGRSWPWSAILLCPPPVIHLCSSIFSYIFCFLAIHYNLGMITLEMWSQLRKVGLGKGLVQALDMVLTSFGQGIPGFQASDTCFRRGKPPASLSLSLGLSRLPALGHSEGKTEKGHLKYSIQPKGPSFLGLRIVLAGIIHILYAYGKYQCKCRPSLLKIFF